MGKDGEKNKISPYSESTRRRKVKICLVRYLGIDVLTPINFAHDGMDDHGSCNQLDATGTKLHIL